jgi:16S rRNA (cytidine1402-2'-O)-methyltransferase
MQKGSLYLVPTLLSEGAVNTIPSSVKDVIADTDHYIVENLKSARRFIKAIYKEKNIDACEFIEMDKHNNYSFEESFLNIIFEGKNIAVLSEAGAPCIADPGNKIVQAAHELEIEVVPLAGPSSILMALMASGFNGQQFTFHGYLPVDANERKTKLLQMEAQARKDHTQIFMDTPYRNMKLLEEIIHVLKFDTMLTIACNLTAADQYIHTLPLSEWKKRKPDLQKKPAIFILGK